MPDRNSFMSFEIIKVENGRQCRFECVLNPESTWMELVDEAIVPALKAMGYNVDRSELDVN